LSSETAWNLNAGPDETWSERTAFVHYLKEARRIISWDEDAIRRTQDDPRALGYGLFFWMASNVLPAALWDAGAGLHKWGSAHLLVSVIAQLVFSAFAIAAQLGLIHLFAFHFLGASGSFVQILRPLSLASVVWLVQLLPVLVSVVAGWGTVTAGVAIASVALGGLAWIAVIVMVFDVVDDISQLTTFVLATLIVAATDLLQEIATRRLP
jgi:hypothetical protein